MNSQLPTYVGAAAAAVAVVVVGIINNACCCCWLPQVFYCSLTQAINLTAGQREVRFFNNFQVDSSSLRSHILGRFSVGIPFLVVVVVVPEFFWLNYKTFMPALFGRASKSILALFFKTYSSVVHLQQSQSQQQQLVNFLHVVINVVSSWLFSFSFYTCSYSRYN